MTRHKTLLVRTDARGVVSLTLNRADKRNALNATMIGELTEFAQTVGQSPDTRAIVLSGAGNVFCAGGDLDWMRAQINANREVRLTEARKLALMLQALNEMPAPLIGKLHGGAFGGGVGLACICDVVVAVEGTKFGLTETRLGLIPATISPYVLARMGEGHARRVFMSSRIFDVTEAKELGIVARIALDSTVDALVEAEVAPYLSAAPRAVGLAKALARSLGHRIDQAVIEDSIERLAYTWDGPEAAEGIDAFFGKRLPDWVKMV